jgi:acyl-CoA synthetase (AMP-forming)/AMP-acid ligase II
MAQRSGRSHIPPAANLVDLLRWRAGRGPERIGFTFLVDGDRQESNLSYGALDRWARAIAAWLRARGAAGERVLILTPPGLDFIAAFFGTLYAGAIAIPAFPQRPNRPMPRLNILAADATPRFAMTTTAVLADLAPRLGDHAALTRLEWLATDTVELALADAWQPPAIADSDIAYLQYTSGSTSTPKGAMITHANVIANMAMIHEAFAHPPDQPAVSWLPVYHDMGLLSTVLEPLYVGVPCVFMSPLVFLQRPLRWLQAISRYRAATSGAPNFAYDLCVRKVKPEQRGELDLSAWSLAFSGSEPVRAETLAAFSAYFAPCGFRQEAFYPCYGLAEATLFVTGGARRAAPRIASFDAEALQSHRVKPAMNGGGRLLVDCGWPRGGLEVVVVDVDRGQPVGEGEIGEIWVRGASIAVGYWNRPEESLETFGARLADGRGPFMRTGDLGFVRDGSLFITGRHKDLIIVDGRNHYPHDIELTAEQSHALLKPAASAAFAVEIDGEERVVVVAEADYRLRSSAGSGSVAEDLELAAAAAALRAAVSEHHDLPLHDVVFVRPGTIPRTTSGKIRRAECRARYLRGELDGVHAPSLRRQAARAAAAAYARPGS